MSTGDTTTAPVDTTAAAEAPTREENAFEHELSLPVYSGPLDLLLYLIDKDEIDIFEIPVADVVEQYLEQLQFMKEIDINVAGEYLIMAARLMEIKSRFMLPVPEEEEEESSAEDPRMDLVRQLLEYRKVKEAAIGLAHSRIEHDKRFARLYRHKFEEVEEDAEDELSLGLEDVGIFDIFNYFDQVMRQTMANAPVELTLDEVTIEQRVDQVVERLRTQPRLTFRELTGETPTRMESVGYFQAVLEVARRKLVHVLQPSDFTEIQLRAREDADDHVVLKVLEAIRIEQPEVFKPLEAGLPDATLDRPAQSEDDDDDGSKKGGPPWKREKRVVFKQNAEEELERLSEEDAKLLGRIDTVMARAKAAVDLFEASKGGTIRDPSQLEGEEAEALRALVRAAKREADVSMDVLFVWRRRILKKRQSASLARRRRR